MTNDPDDVVRRVSDLAIDALFASVGKILQAVTIESRRVAIEHVRAEFAGRSIHVGKGAAERIQQRNRAMQKDYAAGLPVAEIARRHCVSPAHARRIIGGRGSFLAITAKG